MKSFKMLEEKSELRHVNLLLILGIHPTMGKKEKM